MRNHGIPRFALLAVLLLTAHLSFLPYLPAKAQSAKGEKTAETMPKHPRIGLALGGGGTRGIAHIAVLRVLEENGIPIDCVAGTSMGAIVGGLYCAGLKPQEIEAIFRSKAFVRSYDTVPIPVRVSMIPIFCLPHLVGYHPYDGLYRGKRFARYMNEKSPGSTKIEELKIPFWAIASNLVDGQPYAIKSGNLGAALQASSAIPELRRPVEVDGQLLVDGGVVANLPVDYCRAMGADIVIAVNVDEELKQLHPHHFRKIGTSPYRCLNMHLAWIDAPQVEKAEITIHPNVEGIQLLSRRIKDMNLALIEGEKSAKEAIPAIKAQIEKKLAQTKEPTSSPSGRATTDEHI